ncbi:MAG: hypothetical protein ACOY0R_19545 [Chloroflexota bacterium]
MSRSLLIGMLACLLLGACMSRTPSPAEPQPTPAAPLKTWSLRLVQSGGIMGLLRSVDVSSDGRMTVTDQRADQTVSRELTAEELARLGELVAQASDTASKNPAVCADCFVYEVTLERDAGGTLAATVDDVNLADSGLAPLIHALRALMDKALQP